MINDVIQTREDSKYYSNIIRFSYLLLTKENNDSPEKCWLIKYASL